MDEKPLLAVDSEGCGDFAGISEYPEGSSHADSAVDIDWGCAALGGARTTLERT